MIEDLRKVDSKERKTFALPGNFSPESVRAIRLAFVESFQHACPQVELEHLLLGLAKESSSPTTENLRTETVNLLSLRKALKEIKPRGPGYSLRVHLGGNVRQLVNKLGVSENELIEPSDILDCLIEIDDETVNAILLEVKFFK